MSHDRDHTWLEQSGASHHLRTPHHMLLVVQPGVQIVPARHHAHTRRAQELGVKHLEIPHVSAKYYHNFSQAHESTPKFHLGWLQNSAS